MPLNLHLILLLIEEILHQLIMVQVNIPLFIVFDTSQEVQDVFHQRYHWEGTTPKVYLDSRTFLFKTIQHGWSQKFLQDGASPALPAIKKMEL